MYLFATAFNKNLNELRHEASGLIALVAWALIQNKVNV